jgi:hypothetical protein
MSTPTRPYIVRDRDTGAVRLVRAATPAQAVRHAVRTRFEVAPASADQVIDLLQAGTAVEAARAEPQAELPGTEVPA